MLMEHNKETYEQFKAMLLERKECCLVAATGAGKTYITLQLIKDLNLKALIVCPKVSICNEWNKTSCKYNIHNVNFTTYHMFYKHYSEIDGYDIYIFDEAHHMGAPVWGRSIEIFRSRLNNNIMVVGLTQDPNRYEVKIRKQINNIASTIFNDHTVYGYNREDAINAGIFLPATYVYAIFDTEGIRSKYSKMDITEELIGKLDLSIENTMKINDILIRHTSNLSKIKGILFVESIDSINDGINVISDVFPHLDQYIIHSGLSRSSNSRTIKSFDNSESGFMIAVDMVSEGVHFSGVNVVVMLRKTNSPSIYSQQIGRCFSANATENAIVFDFVGNAKSIKSTLDRFMNDTTPIHIQNVSRDREYEHNISDQHIVYDYTVDILSVIQEIEWSTSSRKSWTAEEIQILKDNYPIMKNEVFTLLPGRTAAACRKMAYDLRLVSKVNYWTEEEDNIIREKYPYMGNKIIDLLPNRSIQSIHTRATNLKVKYVGQWTTEEDDILRKHYKSMGYNVSKLLNDKSKKQIMHRVNQLNMSRNKRWTKEEEDILIEYYPKIGDDVYKLLPNRNRASCHGKANQLNLKLDNPSIKRWSKEEDDILKEFYPSMGTEVSNLINGRSKLACSQRALLLGISKDNRIWTLEEDNIIVQFWPDIDHILKLLPNRTKMACQLRAGTLKLRNIKVRPWTKEEDDILIANYPNCGKNCYKLIPNRTEIACRNRVRLLGLYVKK